MFWEQIVRYFASVMLPEVTDCPQSTSFEVVVTLKRHQVGGTTNVAVLNLDEYFYEWRYDLASSPGKRWHESATDNNEFSADFGRI